MGYTINSGKFTATLDRYIEGNLDPTLWLRDPRGTPLHQMIVQQREYRILPRDMVIEFIRCMKRLLSRHGDFQHGCILCRKQLPTRWMIILCEECEHNLVGGGGRFTLSLDGIEILYFLHRLVEDIHRKRLSGNTSIPSVEVDAITEGMVQSVIAGTETGEDWWLPVPSVNADVYSEMGPLGGAPSPPPPLGAHSCPASMAASFTSETIRSSRALRLARLAESSRRLVPR